MPENVEAKFTDRHGEERIVRRRRGGLWQVKQPNGKTVSQGSQRGDWRPGGREDPGQADRGRDDS